MARGGNREGGASRLGATVPVAFFRMSSRVIHCRPALLVCCDESSPQEKLFSSSIYWSAKRCTAALTAPSSSYPTLSLNLSYSEDCPV